MTVWYYTRGMESAGRRRCARCGFERSVGAAVLTLSPSRCPKCRARLLPRSWALIDAAGSFTLGAGAAVFVLSDVLGESRFGVGGWSAVIVVALLLSVTLRLAILSGRRELHEP